MKTPGQFSAEINTRISELKRYIETRGLIPAPSNTPARILTQGYSTSFTTLEKDAAILSDAEEEACALQMLSSPKALFPARQTKNCKRAGILWVLRG
jgi:hypothetical protein